MNFWGFHPLFILLGRLSPLAEARGACWSLLPFSSPSPLACLPIFSLSPRFWGIHLQPPSSSIAVLAMSLPPPSFLIFAATTSSWRCCRPLVTRKSTLPPLTFFLTSSHIDPPARRRHRAPIAPLQHSRAPDTPTHSKTALPLLTLLLWVKLLLPTTPPPSPATCSLPTPSF